MPDNPHPQYRQDRCEHCAAGLAMGMLPGKHWTGNHNPPACTAPTEAEYIAALEGKLASLRQQLADADRINAGIERGTDMMTEPCPCCGMLDCMCDPGREPETEGDYETRL